MTLVKNTPTVAKSSPITKVAVSSLAGKSPPSMKKSVDTSPSKKPSPPSSLKSKPISAPIKSPAKVEKSPIEGVKSPIKVEKSPKLTITKSSVGSTIKTPPLSTKNPMTKSPTAETRTSVRVVKPVSTPKTPEPKQPGFKIDLSVRSSPEKQIGSKTNVTSPSILKKSPVPSVKSISSPVKSVSSPVKSVSSPVKSVSSPVKSVSSPAKSVLSPVKSLPSPVKSASSLVKPLQSPGKSVSSPVKSVSLPVKLLSSPVKSAPPVKPISSPAKLISSPIKSKPTREVKPSPTKTIKDPKTKVITSLSIKKPVGSVKSPIKTTPPSGDSSAKSKLSIKNPISCKAVKPETVVKQPSAKTSIVETSNHSACIGEKTDLCHCADTTEKCSEFSNPPPTEYAIDNENFDVVQAFKVAEQLIKIQSNDRNLETFENTSIVNWDDVITPCDNFVVTESSVENAFVPLIQNDLDAPSCTPEDLILKHDNCIIEMTDLNTPSDSEVSTTNPHSAENLNMIEIEAAESSSGSEYAETQSTDEKYFSDCFSSASICSESIETESNDIFANDLIPKRPDELIRSCNENVLPEWTITIDEFSLDLNSKENQLPSIYEITDENMVEKTSCNVNMSYADVLKKIPNVLVNSTNVQCRKKEPKLNVNLHIKRYQMLKKGEALYSTTVFFNNIENNYQDCDDNYYYEEPEYCEMRKKKSKKIKHLSKRHFRNINREFECIENHADVFVTSVWKNIY